MPDPGTFLAVVSLAIQVSKGLMSFYDEWTHADEDIAEVQQSLLALWKIFAQIDITSKTPVCRMSLYPSSGKRWKAARQR
jgi:hypothetical protein